jgi:hypothetical protein
MNQSIEGSQNNQGVKLNHGSETKDQCAGEGQQQFNSQSLGQETVMESQSVVE